MSRSVLSVIFPSSNASADAVSPAAESYRIEAADAPGVVARTSSLPAESVDEVTVSGGGRPDDSTLFELYRVLKPGGKLLVNDCMPSKEAGQELNGDIEIAGFVNSMVAKDVSSGSRFILAHKPAWTAGSSAPVKVAVVQQQSSATWKMGAADTAEDDLVDESALLDDGLDIKRPAACGEDGDMPEGSGKRRACKNCTCGMAEEEERGAASAAAGPKSVEERAAKASSCGNCAKGDAFRCAGCPFLGLPAFEPGQEKVILAMKDDF
jgi:hypothetical protein